MQKINLIHNFVFKIQRVYCLTDWNIEAIIDSAQTKIIEATFNFPIFVPASKKPVYPTCSFLR